MDYKTVHPLLPDNGDALGIIRITRQAPPSHYTVKIESLSRLLEILNLSDEEKFESGEFEACGHKWKLVFYPLGDVKGNGSGHISLYCEVVKKPISSRFQVDVILKLFVYDHIRDNYLVVQGGTDAKVLRYHALRTKHGFPKLLSLETFNDSSNGYLVDDSCAFGAELHVISCAGRLEMFSILKKPDIDAYTWNIEKFSELKEDHIESDIFTIAEQKWWLSLYPRGDSGAKGKHLSIYLHWSKDGCQPSRIFVKYKMLVKSQVSDFEETAERWFCNPRSSGWGFVDFMPLTTLNEKSNRCLENDELIVEVKITPFAIFEASLEVTKDSDGLRPSIFRRLARGRTPLFNK